MTTITLEHVTKHFASGESNTLAVDDVSLRITAGEVVILLGPSGCGKTTLLRLIAGLETPDSGRVLFDNVPITDVHIRDRNIGMVFQESALFPHLEARESVGFFMKLREREEEVPERVREISSITGFGLDALMGRFPRTLSGGEQQRLAIARALTRDLEVLLLDEPFANLDAPIRHSARVELKRLLARYNVTTVHVTHDQVEAMALGSRIAVMNEGRIVQHGSYQHLYETPFNRFIATFIGSPPINLFDGFAYEGEWRGDTFGPYPIRQDLPAHTRIQMGARPEVINLSADGHDCRVMRLTSYFSERRQLVEVRANGEEWAFFTELDANLRVGEHVTCQLDPSQVIYFDSESGQRVG